MARASGLEWALIGGGSNLVIADAGVRGIVLRYEGSALRRDGRHVFIDAGAGLQELVDFAIAEGLSGLEMMTGIPGSVGGAVYGNAGAYGHSIQEVVRRVEFFDGAEERACGNGECGFAYRESLFKRHKERLILGVELELDEGDAAGLKKSADEILELRNRKYPPAMRCAGSFFKNCLWAQLPETAREAVPRELVRDGKIPSAWFLEQVGAKGRAHGGIRIADYHANTPYNAGGGTAREVRELIAELKGEVRAKFGFDLEEEVQYLGFGNARP